MGFRIPHFQHFPPFASIIFLSFLIFQHPPCPRRVPYRQVEPVTQGISPHWVHGSPLFFRVARVQPLGTCMAGTVRVASGSVQGCRGRSPRQNKLIVSPFPGGEGGWGDGAKKQAKGRADRRQERQAPRRVHGSPLFSRAARVQPRGCKGRSPLHEITLGTPFPGGEGGRGDGGRKEGKGRGQQAAKKAHPRRAPAWQELYVSQAVKCRGAGGEAPGKINL